MYRALRPLRAFVFLAAGFLLSACGGGGGASNAAPPNPPIPPAGTVALLAGNMAGPGNADGIGATARFKTPYGVATDSAGNVFVADSANYTIRKITPAGLVSTIAGGAGVWGSADGVGTAARFKYPNGVAVDVSGNIFVADISNHTIRKITPAGVVSTLAGSSGVPGREDGVGSTARFNTPYDVATDSAGNVYVGDSLNAAVRKITPAGVVTTLAGSGARGSADGVGAVASFQYPYGVATDIADNVYVADSENHTIRKITPSGVVSTLAGSAGLTGSVDGMGAAARFVNPYGVATDAAGNVYVADRGNNAIRKITPTGLVSTIAGGAGVWGSVDGLGSAATFHFPNGVAADNAGNVYVADSENNSIRKITPAGSVSTLAGSAVRPGSADGVGTAAGFNVPFGIAADSAGIAYVADGNNHTIRKITPAGVVSTLAGTAGVTGADDGVGSAATFASPYGIATDKTGNVFAAEIGISHYIRKISPAGVVSTFAGSGARGSADGTATTAAFNVPIGLVTDSSGNVYVADRDNHTIRKISPTGSVSTLAGSAGLSGSFDGIGVAARFSAPNDVAVDKWDNIYVTERDNHTVRKITPAGVVSTLAGSAGSKGAADGNGSTARFNAPQGVATDDAGNVYVADRENHTIRKITPTGDVTTVAGVAGRGGFASGALPGLLYSPRDLAVIGAKILVTMQSGIAEVTLQP